MKTCQDNAQLQKKTYTTHKLLISLFLNNRFDNGSSIRLVAIGDRVLECINHHILEPVIDWSVLGKMLNNWRELLHNAPKIPLF